MRMDTEQGYVGRAAGILRQARRDSGLSARELARRGGTSHATILAYEQGRKVPSVATYLRILESCGFAVDIVATPRVRHRDGLDRGEELAAVLRLAEQFPSRVPRHMNYPTFPRRA